MLIVALLMSRVGSTLLRSRLRNNEVDDRQVIILQRSTFLIDRLFRIPNFPAFLKAYLEDTGQMD
jgi:hypothetical protein